VKVRSRVVGRLGELTSHANFLEEIVALRLSTDSAPCDGRAPKNKVVARNFPVWRDRLRRNLGIFLPKAVKAHFGANSYGNKEIQTHL
jgi:hypothetical protein